MEKIYIKKIKKIQVGSDLTKFLQGKGLSLGYNI